MKLGVRSEFLLTAALAVACGGRSTTDVEKGSGARGGSVSTGGSTTGAGGSGTVTTGGSGTVTTGGTGVVTTGGTGAVGAGGTANVICYYAGTYYSYGDSYPAGDGCNYCTCTLGGSNCGSNSCGGVVTATGGSAGVGQGCVYDGALYALGAMFLEPDGCTECQCTATGVACSATGCGTAASCDDILSKYDAAFTRAQKCTPGTGTCDVLVTTPLCRCETYVSSSAELDPLLTAWDDQLCSQRPTTCPLCGPVGSYHYCDNTGTCVSSDTPPGGASGMGGLGGAAGLAGMAGFATAGFGGVGGFAAGGLGGAASVSSAGFANGGFSGDAGGFANGGFSGGAAFDAGGFTSGGFAGSALASGGFAGGVTAVAGASGGTP